MLLQALQVMLRHTKVGDALQHKIGFQTLPIGITRMKSQFLGAGPRHQSFKKDSLSDSNMLPCLRIAAL